MYSNPSLAPRTCVLAINSRGGLHDRLTFDATGTGDETWRTKGMWAVKVEPKRWLVEVAVPFAELGCACRPGDVGRDNCVRARSSVHVRKHRTSSSLSCGVVHGEGNYMKLKFAE